ncbi:hypothetical protein HOLleu_02037 [Holothuria leucospilota]|uniref:Uncharacterized protein n=1 Tax=Holothuria leucospilota TaxID=206669 RepID=A0A9Q1HL50_HOLLE|nr:hypothetical protein HOLleu_02037 [Holothuria leucospilota]
MDYSSSPGVSGENLPETSEGVPSTSMAKSPSLPNGNKDPHERYISPCNDSVGCFIM